MQTSTLVLVSGPDAGSSLLPRNACDGLTGWGAVMSGHPAHGLWSSRHLMWHIICLEILAVFRALKHFLPDLRDCHVLVRTDNTEVVSYINHQGGLRSRPLYKLAHLILVWFQGKLLSLSMGDSHQEGSHFTSGGYDPSPPPGAVEAVGVASEGAQLVASGLSTEVVETILQSRAPSTRKLYALKWKLFTSWCRGRQLDQVNCPVGTVLEFLQARFSAGLTHSTLKVYVVAFVTYHAPLGGQSGGRHPLVTRFLHGALRLRLRLRPPTREAYAKWWIRMLFHSLESSDLPSPLGVKAHSTRSMAAFKAFLAGVPMQDICNAAGWSTPLTFIRFYRCISIN